MFWLNLIFGVYMQPQVIKFTSYLPMFGGSLQVLWLLPPLNKAGSEPTPYWHPHIGSKCTDNSIQLIQCQPNYYGFFYYAQNKENIIHPPIKLTTTI
jgi:hypothetical protein